MVAMHSSSTGCIRRPRIPITAASTAMPARKFQKKAAKAKGQGKQKDNTEDKNKTVPKFMFFAKQVLAAYPDREGTPFHMGPSEDEGEFFSKGGILRTRNKNNCELYHRLGMALCLGASSFAEGFKALAKGVPDTHDLLTTDELRQKIGKPLQASGMSELHKIFGDDDGKRFIEAVQVLNAGTDKKPAEKRVREAIGIYVDFINSKGAGMRKALSRTATASAKLYLMSMTLLEHVDFHDNRKGWAKRIQDVDKQPRAVRRWIREPMDDDKLKAALVEAFMEKIKSNKTSKGKKKKNVMDSESGDASGKASEAEDSDAQAVSSSNSGSEDSGRKGNDKRKREQSDESSASSDAKKHKKHKKHGAKKKSKQSSSSSDSPKAKKKETAKGAAGKMRSEPKTTKESCAALPSDSEDGAAAEDVVAFEAAQAWTIGKIQECEAALQTWSSMMHDSVAGPTTKKLQDMIRSIPPQALKLGQLDDLAKEVAAKTKLGKRQTAAVIDKIGALCRRLIAFSEAQAGKSTASATPLAGAADPPVDDKKSELEQEVEDAKDGQEPETED